MTMRRTEAVRANGKAALALAEEHDLESLVELFQMETAWADAVEGIGGEDLAAASLQGFNRASPPTGAT